MATDHSVLTMENNLGIVQLVDKVKAIFDTDPVLVNVFVNYVNSRLVHPFSNYDSTNLDNWSICFSPEVSTKSYLLTINPDELTNRQTEHLIESVFGDDEDDTYIISFKARHVLALMSEDESIFRDKIMSLLFSHYWG